jgi:hypothetical protein
MNKFNAKPFATKVNILFIKILPFRNQGILTLKINCSFVNNHTDSYCKATVRTKTNEPNIYLVSLAYGKDVASLDETSKLEPCKKNSFSRPIIFISNLRNFGPKEKPTFTVIINIIIRMLTE